VCSAHADGVAVKRLAIGVLRNFEPYIETLAGFALC
jgi:hypothetical protein